MAFPRSSGLYSHQRSHENAQKSVKDLPCSICGKMFRSKASASFCAKTHKADGNFQCSFEGCKEKFTNSIKYQSHSTHHYRTLRAKKNKIPCNNCDKAFESKSDLRRHTFYMHEKREKTIPCSLCPKMFISKERLERHLLIHNDTSFECPFEGCGVKRKIKFQLNFHYKEKHGQVAQRKSTAERLAKANERVLCTLCKQKVYKKALKKHIETHAKHESIGCVIEGCSYNLPPQFYKHLEKEHNVDLNEQKVCVDFKCNHYNEVLTAESAKGGQFWNRKAQNWSELLRKHLITKHAGDVAQNLDIKNDWKLHYENGVNCISEGEGGWRK